MGHCVWDCGGGHGGKWLGVGATSGEGGWVGRGPSVWEDGRGSESLFY